MRPYKLIAKLSLVVAMLGMMLSIVGCSTPKHPLLPEATGQMRYSNKYLIGPGDQLEIFVWRYPEVTTSVVVRPDGYLTANLLEDVPAAGKTPTELARDLEKELSVFLRDPLVTVIVSGFQGVFPEQIRVVGEATQPKALQYTDGMTLLDVMILVGGITEFASGNSTVLVRTEAGLRNEYTVKLEDLIKDGDIAANVDMRPGDILIIPEAWF
jgi:polysaccharide export outer membrane protein